MLVLVVIGVSWLACGIFGMVIVPKFDWTPTNCFMAFFWGPVFLFFGAIPDRRQPGGEILYE